jgi:hypothetical protein
VLSDVHDHHLVKVLQHLLASPDRVSDTDYECLAFMYQLLAQRLEEVRASVLASLYMCFMHTKLEKDHICFSLCDV